MSNPNPSYYSGLESIWHKLAVKSRPSKRLPVQSEQKKHYKRSEICSKITMNEDNITTSFDQVFVSWDCLSLNASHAMRAVICGPCKSNPWLVGLFGNQWKHPPVLSPCLILNSEAATRGVLWKKLFLEISQNSQENTCSRVSFLINLQARPKIYWNRWIFVSKYATCQIFHVSSFLKFYKALKMLKFRFSSYIFVYLKNYLMDSCVFLFVFCFPNFTKQYARDV